MGNDHSIRCWRPPFLISIHVPAWGTTSRIQRNSALVKISIHVPAWGTTENDLRFLDAVLNFNPRSRVGNDRNGHLLMQCSLTFQSTFPRGERPFCNIGYKSAPEFQSTFPRGERPARILYCWQTCMISIHVPAWGTTLFQSLHFCLLRNFNPRSRVGNDSDLILNKMNDVISIHVPAWGTTME